MRYFVVAPDGSQYGPADLATLRAWLGEGRLLPDSILIEEGTGRTVPARVVLGLGSVEMPIQAPPSRRGRMEGGFPQIDRGNRDISWSYFWSAMTLICCLLCAIPAFIYANSAARKGHPGATAAKVVAVIMLILWVALTGVELAFFQQIKEMVGL